MVVIKIRVEGWISNLSGLFDGYRYHNGPISVYIDGTSIGSILKESQKNNAIDGSGHILTPGFVDGHTHLIFGGTRFGELTQKLEGKSYSEILSSGGGIQSTVQNTRRTSKSDLLGNVYDILNVMLSHGTLQVEAKSGYGLNYETEIKLLEILNEADDRHQIHVHPTFGAAHVFPPEVSRDEYLESIIKDMLPEVVERNLASSTDVFCDKGAFTVNETLSIFDTASSSGHPVRVHAEELQYTGIAQIASQKYHLLSADHLLHAQKNDFDVLASNNTTAMFMPLAPFGLFTDQLPRGFIESNVNIGLGSDFNPNNWSVSMQTAIRMAVFKYRMTPLQAIKAATSGSYQGVTGSQLDPIQESGSATFILLKANSLAEFVSKLGQNLVVMVFKDGKMIHRNDHLIL